jgi:hypothetical protein
MSENVTHYYTMCNVWQEKRANSGGWISEEGAQIRLDEHLLRVAAQSRRPTRANSAGIGRPGGCGLESRPREWPPS